MKIKAPTKAKSIAMLAVAGVLIAILIAFSVVFAVLEPFFSLFLGGTALDSASREQGEALSSQIVEEGAVLLKNDNNCLPLAESDLTVGDEMRVNVFGWAATQWVMGGSGSGRATNDGNISKIGTGVLQALKDAGINYNTELTSMYTSFYNKRPFYDTGNGGALSVHDYEYCRLIEPTFDSYTDTIKNNALQYSDVAIVVLGRISGESIDCPTAQYKNYTGYGTSPNSGALKGAAVDKNRTYLEISTEEEDLLKYVAESYEKVIVLINNTNAMNLGFLRDIQGIDACLMIGGTGVNGANAIPGLLLGKKTVNKTDENGNVIDTETVDVSPAGKTVDTFVYDFTTNPSFAYTAMDGVTQYTGLKPTDGIYPYDNNTTNGNTSSSVENEKYPGVSYLDYVEGVYVGYKWYETADAEGFWSSDFAKKTWNVSSYKDVVQFPFGYGLSYTNFKWSVRGWSVNDGKISVEVNVRNNGSKAAQEVVELYFTPPYTPGGLEKPAVSLAAFAKTPVAVKPGETQLLTLSFDIQDMASYDQDRNGGKYVLEKGSYVISLRTDSHTVATVEAGSATYTYNVNNAVEYDTYTGTNGTEKIHNLFVGDDISDGVAVDGSDTEQNIQWLSRNDFAGTFLTEKAKERSWKSALKKNNIYGQADVNEWEAANKTDVQVKVGQDKGINIYDSSAGVVNATGITYGNPDNYNNDELWDALLDQLTINEMLNLSLHGYVHEEALDSIGKPKTTSFDGPSQVGSFNATKCGVGYPNATVLAQSWNAELARSFGLAAGAETRKMNYNGWYAPGTNLHRSAFGGRNYEYYSEDSYLSGVFCAEVVRGALNAGTYTYIKHFIGYDQESLRDGLYCWMTEQALRETYLRPYKMAIDMGASGIMTSYGRVGAVWSGGSKALLTDLLRDEWGYKGAVLTDYSDHQTFMNADQMIRNGGDLWMDGYTTGKLHFNTNVSSFSNAFIAQLRSASKHVIYAYLNAAYEENAYKEYVKEHGDGMVIEYSNSGSTFKWWWLVFAIVDILLVAGAAVLGLFGVTGVLAAKKQGASASAAGADNGADNNVDTATTDEIKDEAKVEEANSDQDEGKNE